MKDHEWDSFVAERLPAHHTIVVGETTYWAIQHRVRLIYPVNFFENSLLFSDTKP